MNIYLRDETNFERSVVSRNQFNWEQDEQLSIPFDEVIASVQVGDTVTITLQSDIECDAGINLIAEITAQIERYAIRLIYCKSV